MTIEAKVAQVLTSREVAINAGRTAGVKVGDVARVVRVVDVKDPDSDASLGAVQYKIVNLRITSVSELFSVGRTYELTGGSDPISQLLASTQGGRQVQQVEGTPSAGNQIYVQPGSRVVIDTPAEPLADPDMSELPF